MTKELFCPACVTVPLAFAGAGMSISPTDNDEDKKTYNTTKTRNLCFGMIFTLIVFLISIYFLYIRKCNDCR